MKQLLSLCLVCLLSSGDSAFGQQASPQVPAAPSSPDALASGGSGGASSLPAAPNTLMDGTEVKLRLGETISSATAKTGQQVPFEVVEEVAVMGVPVIAKGAQALATVTDASTRKSMGRGGKLDVNVDSVRLVDGEKAQLRAVQGGKGGGHVGAMTGAIVATSIVFFPAAPLFLFVHGKDITIPKGTEVTAFVQGDMRLDMARMSQVGAPAWGTGAFGGAQMASLTIDSAVGGADIEMDGSFVGSTPSTVSVVPGQHRIAVKKKGYADWSRTMNVSGSSVRVNVELEKVMEAQ